MILFYCLYGVFLGGYLSLWQPSILARGFTVANLATLIAVRTVIDISASIPTGILADKVGRKKTVILGLLAFLISLLVPIFNASPIAIAIAVLGFSIGDNCIDGALDTWASRVVQSKSEKHHVRNFISRDQIQRMGLISGALLVSLSVNKLGLSGNLHWVLTDVVVAALVVCAILIPNGKEDHEVNSQEKFAFQTILNAAPMAIMLGTFFFGLSDGSIEVGLVPRFKELGLETAFGFGVLQASMSTGRLIGSQLWKNSHVIDRAWVPAVALLGSSIFYFVFAVTRFTPKIALTIWVLRIMVLAAYFSTLRALILRSTSDSRFHATALSFNTTAYLLGKLVFTGLTAALLGGGELSKLLLWGAIFSLVSGVLYLNRSLKITK